jgi:hypothetical protein
MSVEERRRYKHKSKKDGDTKEKKLKNDRHNPKKEFSPEELEARKRAQRLSLFDKKTNLKKMGKSQIRD